MLKLDNNYTEVHTGVLANDKKELIVTFRRFSNTDDMNRQLGVSVTQIVFDMFLRFNYPVEALIDGEVIKCTTLRQLASLPRCNEIKTIIDLCIAEVSKDVLAAPQEALEVEKKPASAGKSSKQEN